MLNQDNEEFLVEEATELLTDAAINLIVHIPTDEVSRSGEVEAAIHQRFAYQSISRNAVKSLFATRLQKPVD